MATKKIVKKLRLFVWENVLQDYYPGIMFALAVDKHHARELISPGYTALKKEHAKNPLAFRTQMDHDLDKEPQIITKPQGFSVDGGG